MIELFLCISVCLNVMFVFYSRWLIRILKSREEDVNELADVVYEYVTHVKSVHEMEMFYGDQTLQSLISHGTEMVEKIEGFDFLELGESDQPIGEYENE
tara:strand:+ start:507 stop:803 length:297 start_codon:yes stop_codon:yes gene_type:complete